jgi:hypothetical protein
MPMEELRLQLLKEAGITPEILKEAVSQLRAALHATETKLVTWDGEIKQRIEVSDWAAILRASDQLFSLLGMYAPRREQGGGGKVEVEITVPSWARVKATAPQPVASDAA